MGLQLFAHHRVCIDRRIAAGEDHAKARCLDAPEDLDGHLLVAAIAEQQAGVVVLLDADVLMEVKFLCKSENAMG